MTHPLHLTLSGARDALRTRALSSVELTQAFLSQMEKNRSLNAYVLETPEHALEAAKKSDIRLQKGQGGALEGLPIAIKDLYCTKGVRTTACSRILSTFVPPYESTVTHNLLDQGAVFLGKTNMDEFAMGSANITSFYGPVESPWKRKSDGSRKLVPGGSSGGSASAVAARMALAATASDTGGSIRQPASFCGLVGIKPTYGLCSRWGMIAFASSLDQAGPLTHTVRDAALMLNVMAGFDEKDATSLNVKIPDYEANLSSSVKGLKIGIPDEYVQGLSPRMQRLMDDAIAWYQAEGAQIVRISLKTTSYALPTYYIIAPAEASANLARFDGLRYGMRVNGATLDEMYENSRADGFGDEVKRRIMIGTYVLSAGYYDAYYIRAQKIKQMIINDFNDAFKKVDILLTPTTTGAAFAIDEKPSDPVEMYLNDIYTVTVNLAGLPGISVPAGYDDEGLPLGLQLIGPSLSEQCVLNAALVIEQSASFKGLEG
jgi:aspartyl-tRNA(Asn)/glutamyl-tRNA(Gln) amidotransferase subunit A